MHKAHTGCTRMLTVVITSKNITSFHFILFPYRNVWICSELTGKVLGLVTKNSKCDQETNKVFLMLILKEQQLHRQHLQGKKHRQLGTMINWKSVTEQPQWRLPAQERSSKTFKNKESLTEWKKWKDKIHFGVHGPAVLALEGDPPLWWLCRTRSEGPSSETGACDRGHHLTPAASPAARLPWQHLEERGRENKYVCHKATEEKKMPHIKQWE